jgi:carbamoyltransferase
MRVLAFNITHDSSVCSINNGKIEFFCKEERLTRLKRDSNPFKSLETFKEVPDHVLYCSPKNDMSETENLYSDYIRKKFNVQLENFSNLSHHLCHASLAFYNSEFEKCLVFVIDRQGSVFFHDPNGGANEAESVFVCSYPDNLIPIHKSFWLQPKYDHLKFEIKRSLKSLYPNVEISVSNSYSIAKVYEAATTLIGQSSLDAGKTMGLASYGEDFSYDSLFSNNEAISEYFSQVNLKFPNLNFVQENSTCFFDYEDAITRQVDKNNYQFYANKAKHVQIETQKQALKLIDHYVKKTKINNVCLVGGYALNVVANNYYVKNLPNVNFYFEPVADDTGISIGSAMYKYRTLTGDTRIIVPENNFYHYYSDEELIGGTTCSIENLVDILISQKPLAIFEGQPEVGPRALGHRSILFDPRNKDTKEIVNRVKKREWYRPFAGVVLKEHFHQYFETLNLEESPYMTINFDCKPGTKEYVPGVVHVDNTCRVQTVSEGFLFDLLTAFYKRTGCPILLNTSFNLAGEALVQTKRDAINTLNCSNLDFVYFVEDKKIISKSESIDSLVESGYNLKNLNHRVN